jgi:signal transduction histidine kinase
MIPNKVKEFLVKNNEKQGCFCMAIDENLKIINSFGQPGLLGFSHPKTNELIYDFFPQVVTETFENDFEIPFFNINTQHVCNIYFLKYPKLSYLLLIDKSEIFQITQKYQQFAHDDNISKNKFKKLAEELARAKQKLKKSNEEKATLIAMLSHELGTPLTSIIGYSELMLNQETECNKGIEIINRNAIYLKNMIENTLLFGRSEAGGIQIQTENIQVSDLLDDLKSTLLPTANNKNLILSIENNANANCVINIDITRTKQVLINLLNNAVKYTEKGSVKLLFNQSDDKHFFSIIDTGLGIPNHLKDAIFNPWERVKESTEKGTGIGLFISQNLAQSMGGEIILVSSNASDGSTFQLSLPQLNTSTQNFKNNEITSNKCAGKSLIVIDDDNDILELIEALLQTTKLKIFTALNLESATKQLENHTIDIILTDLNLGLTKASSFICRIKDKYKNIPVLLMTAMPSNETQNNYKSLGFNGLIQKPLNTNDLIKTITENL